MMHHVRTKHIVAVVALLAFCAWAWKVSEDRAVAAVHFYADALRDAQVETQVSVGDQTYQEKNGEVTRSGIAVVGIAALPALELAYAQSLAERHPPIDLSGVNPDALSALVKKLETDQADLASVQKNSADAGLIPSLYPTRFLETLGPLERARQNFITSGSSGDEHAYESALASSAQAGAHDAAAFQRALPEALSRTYGSQTFIFPGFGGGATSKSVYSAPGEEVERMQELSSAVSGWARCAGGNTASCPLTGISLPTIAKPAAAIPQVPVPEMVREVASTVEQTLPYIQQPSRIFVLSTSACMSALPPPYYFLASLSDTPGISAPFIFIGDLYFQQISLVNQDVFYTYFAKQYQAAYSFGDPNMFYHCSATGADFGRIRALANAAAFAQAHPEIAPEERMPLVSQGPLSESDVAAYLRSALAHEAQTPDTNLHDLVRLALLYNDRTSGLESEISEIVTINGAHVADARRGVPFDVSAADLFLTHNAMETLFLADNPSTGSTTVSQYTFVSNNLKLLYSSWLPYSKLVSTVPLDKLRHDIRAMVDFELPKTN